MVAREQLVRMAKRRGFFFQTASKHGGASGFYTLGPHGESLRQHLADSWRSTFVTAHGFDEIQSPTILPASVFRASGHLDGFDDAMVQCEHCDSVHRADHLVEQKTSQEEAEGLSVEALAEQLTTNCVECPTCGTVFSDPSVTPFNLMFETTIGPQDGDVGYLRPETAQGTLAEMWQLKEYAREQTPFGMAQVGRAYRNEISPRKSILRTREFSQAELQTVVFDEEPPFERVDTKSVSVKQSDTVTTEQTLDGLRTDVHPWVAYYIGLTADWLTQIGIPDGRLRFRQHAEDELAHYASDCWDAEVELHDEWVEVAGLANRGSHDLEAHADATDASYTLFKRFDSPETVETVTVNVDMGVIGPEHGEQAPAIEEALIEKLQQNPDAADNDTISVTVDGETVAVQSEAVEVTVTAEGKNGRHEYPTVIEPAFGLERVLYAVMATTYQEDTVDGERRRRLALPSPVAPTTVMVTAAVTNDDELLAAATSLRDNLRDDGFTTAYEDTGGIGRRYRRHDEIGTPFAVTVDHETKENGTVTLRERDSRQQVRVHRDDVAETLEQLVDGSVSFNEL